MITGGTDNHLLLVDTKHSFGINGLRAQELLEACHITANKNAIPGDDEKPAYTSGLRLGTPAMTTRGYTKEDFILVGKLIAKVLRNPEDPKVREEVLSAVVAVNEKHPLWY